MRPILAALALAVLAATAAGCGSACKDLGYRICECQPVGPLRDSCNNGVNTQLGQGTQPPTSADQAYCQEKLATCPDPAVDLTACDKLNTAEGKAACGLAYPAGT